MQCRDNGILLFDGAGSILSSSSLSSPFSLSPFQMVPRLADILSVLHFIAPLLFKAMTTWLYPLLFITKYIKEKSLAQLLSPWYHGNIQGWDTLCSLILSWVSRWRYSCAHLRLIYWPDGLSPRRFFPRHVKEIVWTKQISSEELRLKYIYIGVIKLYFFSQAGGPVKRVLEISGRKKIFPFTYKHIFRGKTTPHGCRRNSKDCEKEIWGFKWQPTVFCHINIRYIVW